MEDVRLEFSEEIIVKSTNSESEFVDSDGLKKGQLIVYNQGTTFKDIKLSDSRIHINGCSRDFESFDDLSKYVVHLEELSGINNNIDECPFKIGDIISYYGDVLFLFEGINNDNNVLRSFCCDNSVKGCLEKTITNIGLNYNGYTKASPEQERLFKQKCLENNVWFDHIGKKWIKLKEGGLYKCDVVGTTAIFIFDAVRSNRLFSKSSIFKSGSVFIGTEYSVCSKLGDIINISEATKEEQQLLFDALAKKGKQWNADKNCVEDLKWKPEFGEDYYFVDTVYETYKSTFELTHGDVYRLSVGNCFKTEEECEKYAEYMRECSLNYKP